MIWLSIVGLSSNDYPEIGVLTPQLFDVKTTCFNIAWNALDV